ncbi:MotA/TolQ/ExbB proton channel family protein, partial [Vibrio anguillarum]
EIASLGDVLQFIDLSSFLIVAIPSLLAFVVGWFESKTTAIHCAFYSLIFSGILGGIIGLIRTFSDATGDSVILQAGMSVSLLPIFYGLSIALLILPFYLMSKSAK